MNQTLGVVVELRPPKIVTLTFDGRILSHSVSDIELLGQQWAFSVKEPGSADIGGFIGPGAKSLLDKSGIKPSALQHMAGLWADSRQRSKELRRNLNDVFWNMNRPSSNLILSLNDIASAVLPDKSETINDKFCVKLSLNRNALFTRIHPVKDLTDPLYAIRDRETVSFLHKLMIPLERNGLLQSFHGKCRELITNFRKG
jgi:hypothetical protein